MWDQNVFNDLYRRGGGPSVKDDKNVVTGYDGKLKVGILPVSMFASGTPTSSRVMHEKVWCRALCGARYFSVLGYRG